MPIRSWNTEQTPLGAPAVACLAAVCTILLVTAVSGSVAQDAVPFRLAAILYRSGGWPDIYPAADATSLFDVSERYRQTAAVQIGRNGLPTVETGTLTAFVAPPPAAFLLSGLTDAPWPMSLRLIRLSLAIPLALSVVWLAVGGSGNIAVRRTWCWIAVCATPLLLYIVLVGQSAAWLATAAMASAGPAVLATDVTGGVSLMLGVITKATPIGLAVGFCFAGRRRLGLIALSLVAIVMAATWPLTGLPAWTAFAASASHVGRSVITDWNSVSVEATVMRLATDVADPLFRAPKPEAVAIGLTFRAGLLLAAFWPRGWARAGVTGRLARLWIAWLAAAPLLWLHYTAVLVPFLGFVTPRRKVASLICAALLSAPIVMRFIGFSSGATGNTGTVVWLLAVACILWPAPQAKAAVGAS